MDAHNPYFKYWLYKKIWVALDLLYPPICGGCGMSGYRWCPQCIAECRSNTPDLIHNFIYVIPNNHQKTNSSSHIQLPIHSWTIYKGCIVNAIRKLKYHKDIALGEALSKHLIDIYKEKQFKCDLILPIPLSRQRLLERGYNQSGLLAHPLALALGIDYKPKAISRVKDTRSQVNLNAQERLENVENAFYANSDIVYERSVLLIDDVTTTGATLSACSKSLLNAGARNIIALTIAKALSHSQ